MKPETADDVRKDKAAHGVSVMEVARSGGKWQVVKDSPFNRRITADTPMDITGPAAGHDLLKTGADPSGRRALGTWNNWRQRPDALGHLSGLRGEFQRLLLLERQGRWPLSPGFKRLRHPAQGLGPRLGRRPDERFDIAKHPNEPNRAGYVVEIDPLDHQIHAEEAHGSRPHKNMRMPRSSSRPTAGLSSIWATTSAANISIAMSRTACLQPAARMTSCSTRARSTPRASTPTATGEWLALTPQTTGMASRAEVCVHTRMAASGGQRPRRWTARNGSPPIRTRPRFTAR